MRSAIELGYRLFDTAEMYGEGGAETVLGAAVNDALRAGEVSREQLFIVSKVYPHNASRTGTVAACERSLKRLGLDVHRPVPAALAGLAPAGRHRGRF